MGLLEEIREEARAADAATASGSLGRDDRFWRSFSYAFRLRHVHDHDIDATFPLVLNPTKYSKRLPFASEVTPAQDGGVFVERQGVVIGDLTVEGHTGFRPRLNAGDTGAPAPTIPLSGQAHFKRLQDLCFGRYSDLSKDHEVGPGLIMEFHNFKDNEHFIVEPVDFKLDRTVEDRVLYRYAINLKILSQIRQAPTPTNEDVPALRGLEDALANLSRGVAEIEASILDVQGIKEIAEVAASYDDVVTQVLRVSGAATEFIKGTKRTIAIPYNSVRQTQLALDQMIETVEQAANLPADVIQIFRKMVDALDTIRTYPDKFVEPFPTAAERFLELTRGPANAKADDLDAAAASSVTQPVELEKTGLRPGDKKRVEAGIFDDRQEFPRYQGFREITLAANDTLQRLAGRFLGDARRWIDIAIANQLKAPYISNEGVPGTLRPGDPILIPTRAKGGEGITRVRSKGSPDGRASQLEAVLGRDLALAPVQGGRAFDLVIDYAGGATDFKTVAGGDNASQAVGFILSTERGDDVLYQNLGIDRIVGQRNSLDRIVEAELRISEALLRDDRFVEVAGLRFRLLEPGDQLEVEIDATIADNTQSRVIGRVIS